MIIFSRIFCHDAFIGDPLNLNTHWKKLNLGVSQEMLFWTKLIFFKPMYSNHTSIKHLKYRNIAIDANNEVVSLAFVIEYLLRLTQLL